jgi:hypothetical protein
MNEKKQKENERKFKNWIYLEDGGRLYKKEIRGRFGWFAEYIKKVNNQETTLEFIQKIYDENYNLIEIHQKYPEDKGHKKL